MQFTEKQIENGIFWFDLNDLKGFSLTLAPKLRTGPRTKES